MKKMVIKIKKEDLPKPRAGVKPSKVERNPKTYTRKKKHKEQWK